MRCWIFVVMDKDQNIRSQYKEYSELMSWYEIQQSEEVDNEENIEESIQTQFNINICTYKKYTPYVDKVLSTICPGEDKNKDTR